MTENKELKPVDEAKVLALFDDVEYTGKENIDVSRHLKRPMLKIAHTQSAQCKEQNPAYIPILKPGMFFHTVTGKVYGPEVKIIPVAFFANAIVYGPNGLGDFRKVVTEKEYIDAIDNGTLTNSGNGWVDKENLKYVLTYNFVALLKDHLDDGLVLFPLAGKGLTPCKNLLTKIDRAHKKTFMQVWKIWTKYYSENTYEWWQIGEKSRELNAEYLGIIDEKAAPHVRTAIEVAKEYASNVTKIDYGENDYAMATNVETEM